MAWWQNYCFVASDLEKIVCRPRESFVGIELRSIPHGLPAYGLYPTDSRFRFSHLPRHAKDVRVDRHKLNELGIFAFPNDYHTPKLPGLGEVNWGYFFSTLGDIGYRGSVCVEVEDRSYEGSLDGRKEALRQSYRYLRQFVAVA